MYKSNLSFKLDSSLIGDSEIQHLDYSYTSSLIRYFIQDETLVLTIRGRKYTPKFDMNVNNYKLSIESVQTEVHTGYEGQTSSYLPSNNLIILMDIY
ncbi:DUF6997 domain-containing protein [Anabaena sp. FACHB-1237]|uniref:DUF6997 domain-containing protein n=1 Tax=Anabaena sp. FACHB-1237 TaxID=2692769 RepID=UPI0037BFD3B0